MKLVSCLFLLTMAVSPSLSDLKILNLPEGELGPDPCARTCSGVSKHEETGTYYGWHDYDGLVYKAVDMTGCKFVSTPVVAIMSSGDAQYCPNVEKASIAAHRYYVRTEKTQTADQMRKWKCNVHWIATGFIC